MVLVDQEGPVICSPQLGSLSRLQALAEAQMPGKVLILSVSMAPTLSKAAGRAQRAFGSARVPTLRTLRSIDLPVLENKDRRSISSG